MAKQKPLHTIRVARNIKATIWENDGEKGTWCNVVINRTYKDGDALSDTNSYSRDDLLHVARVAQQAYDFLVEQDAAKKDAA